MINLERSKPSPCVNQHQLKHKENPLLPHNQFPQVNTTSRFFSLKCFIHLHFIIGNPICYSEKCYTEVSRCCNLFLPPSGGTQTSSQVPGEHSRLSLCTLQLEQDLPFPMYLNFSSITNSSGGRKSLLVPCNCHWPETAQRFLRAFTEVKGNAGNFNSSSLAKLWTTGNWATKKSAFDT